MTTTHAEYDFKWCPGCGDFGVRRALEFAMQEWTAKMETPMESNVVIAGIGCSGNMVHLLEGPQPYGFHGIHGRTLPLALGVKMARPDLNVVTVAGDGDFLAIGMEHIYPQALRNLDMCALVLDNGIYGLTKGQSSPTTKIGEITASTPFGKVEEAVNPLPYYLACGVTFVASGFSAKPKDLSKLIMAGMEHEGFAVVHIKSPCTTYNDTYDILKGDAKKGIAPLLYNIPEDHDATDLQAAYNLLKKPGVPVGILYQDDNRAPFHKRVEEAHKKAKERSVEEMLSSFAI